MLDLPNQPVIDKARLVGGCLRLPLRTDAAQLQAEIAALPDSVWGSAGGRVGVHSAAQAVFLRGYAPAEGDKPIEERPPLARLPAMRAVIEQLIPAPPLRALLARIPPGGVIAAHIDRAPYFAKSLRIHVPITSHEAAWMHCAGWSYRMAPGEVWVLNNSAMHGVWNADDSRSRTHLICDFLPTSALLSLMLSGERLLGTQVAEVDRHLGIAAASG